MTRALQSLLVVAFLSLVVLRFAEPISDGDLFWHMAYGKQMLAQHTLVPDATIYSWTPADGATAYCSWIPELVFHGIYSVFGFPGLFAFRYLCVGLIAWLLLRYARGFNLQWSPVTFLLLSISLLAGYVGTILKPELFSLVYFHLLAFGYFTLKSRPESRGQWRWAFPLLMLIWANSHGVFVFGLITMLVLCVGEWLNRLLSPTLAMPPETLKAFTLSTLMSGAAVLLTPYGPRYPIQLLSEFVALATGRQSAGDVAAYTNLAAHQRPWEASDFHFMGLAAAMAIILVVLAATLLWRGGRGRRVDLAVVGVNLILGLTFLWYVRTTYYWPPFFVYSAVYLIGHLSQVSAPGLGVRRFLQGLAAAALVAICLASDYQAIRQPYALSWCGFGISYYNPVDEADWIREFSPTDRVMNDYDGGGYLLWKLSPQTRVMIDSRSYPYRSWLASYMLWETGEKFSDFLLSVGDADVAVISVRNKRLWQAFVKSRLYKVGWIGKSSIVFVANHVKIPPIALKFREDRFRSLNNLVQGSDIYEACLSVGFYEEAWSCLRAMHTNFYTTPENRKVIDAFQLYKDAVVADFEVDSQLDKMLELHEKCWKAGVFFRPSRLLELYQNKLERVASAPRSADTQKQVLELTGKIQRLEQGLPYAEP